MLEINDDAAAILISTLMKKLEEKDKKINFLTEVRLALRCFLEDKAKDMVIPWVQFVYEEFPKYSESEFSKNSKEMVSELHDATLDLSTIPCTGTDFEPWGT